MSDERGAKNPSKWRHRVRRGPLGAFHVYPPGEGDALAEFSRRDEAIADAAARDLAAGIKKRACINCRRTFDSTGIGNRMCGTCRNGATSADHSYAVAL